MGNFRDVESVSFESVVHYTNTAVNLRLDCGPLRYHTLGVATIFRFLQTELSDGHEPVEHGASAQLPSYEYVSFGRSGSEPSFQLRYSVREVSSSYQFSLNEMTCLKQIGSWRMDEMWAEIEFNHCEHAIERGPTNRYRLGNFATHDVASIYANFNLTFTSISNFVITFYAKSLMTQCVVGVVKFTPLLEVFFNQQSQGEAMERDHDQQSAAAPIDWLTALRGGLRMIHIDDSSSANSPGGKERPIELTLADFTRSATTRKRLHVEGGGYEILFTISKHARIKEDEELLANTMWKRLNTGTHHDDIQVVVADSESSAMQSITQALKNDVVVPSQNVNQKAVVQGQREVLLSIEEKTRARQATRFSSVDFGAHSAGNYVEVLIDGLQTFRRYYEVMMEARHSISILGWEISLSFGLTLEQVAGADTTSETAGNANLQGHSSSSSFSSSSSGAGSGSRRWISLEDVLIAKAKEGVKVRILVWRHELLSHLNRYLYLGDVTVENEMAKLEKRCKRSGVSVKILHTTRTMPSADSPYFRPFGSRVPMEMSTEAGSSANTQMTSSSTSSSTPPSTSPSTSPSSSSPHPSSTAGSSSQSNHQTSSSSKHHHQRAGHHQHQPHHPEYPSIFAAEEDTDIVVIVAGNPQGLISSHHEKLVLIDPECPSHTVAFTGGFDIARGRYDQPAHLVPLPGKKKLRDAIYKKEMESSQKEERYSHPSIQPVWRSIRFLWHDLQLFIKGPATRSLMLHFVQRWTHCFDPNPLRTRSISLLPLTASSTCSRSHTQATLTSMHTSCVLRLERTWKSVFDIHYLFEDYCKMIKSAERFLYIEHQYPFQNFALTQLMCEQLKSKPELRLIVVTPIKTDLPTGVVGELFDWSQDHIIHHLTLIQNSAPDRVGVYGLMNQDSRFPDKIGGIYVHSKVTLIDDMWMVTGSTNMDNVSFFHSSELSIELYSPQIAKEVRLRLFTEHLGHHFRPELEHDLVACFDTFRDAAAINYKSLRETGILQARPISLTPMEAYNFILSKVYYPNKFTKLLMKLGLSTEDVIQVVGDGVDNVVNFVVQKAKL